MWSAMLEPNHVVSSGQNNLLYNFQNQILSKVTLQIIIKTDLLIHSLLLCFHKILFDYVHELQK